MKEDRDYSVNPDAIPLSIDNILHFGLGSACQSNPIVQKTQVNFETASTLLDRVTATIATLTKQRDQLQQDLENQKQTSERKEIFLNEQISHVEGEATIWERRAKLTKEQLVDCEAELSEQNARVEKLTHRAESAEMRLRTSEQSSTDAWRQVQMYHDMIVATLGNLPEKPSARH